MSTTVDYKRRASLLKAIGQIPGYDLRKTLNESQKRHIRRLWREFHEIATAPDQFFIREVSPQTAKIAKQNAISSHHSKGTKKAKIYVPKDHYENITIKDKKITLRVKEKYVDKQRQILLTPRKNILDRLKWLEENAKLKPYEFVTVRIGNHGMFSNVRISYEELSNYLSGWNPDDPLADREYLISQMSIIKLTNFGMVTGEETPYEPIKRKHRKSIKGKRTSRGR